MAEEHQRVKAQLTTPESEIASNELELRRRDEAADKFDGVAELLANMDIDRVWNEANPAEKRILVEDMIDSVIIYPDQLTVQVAGAPPILVTLEEVDLTQGCRIVVSKAVVSKAGRLHPSVGRIPLRLLAMVVPPYWCTEGDPTPRVRGFGYKTDLTTFLSAHLTDNV